MTKQQLVARRRQIFSLCGVEIYQNLLSFQSFEQSDSYDIDWTDQYPTRQLGSKAGQAKAGHGQQIYSKAGQRYYAAHDV